MLYLALFGLSTYLMSRITLRQYWKYRIRYMEVKRRQKEILGKICIQKRFSVAY